MGPSQQRLARRRAIIARGDIVAQWLLGAWRAAPRTPTCRPARALKLGVRRITLLLMVASLSEACALVHSYDDPSGPRFEGQYSSSTDRSSAELTIVTFNIQFASEISRALEEIESSTQLSDASIVLLQEMDLAGTDRIAARLGLDFVYYPGSKHQGKDFGNAVLSRWPIESDHKLILPYRNPANGRIRIAVAASLETPEGMLHVYSVHTETPWLGPRARLEQVSAIAEDASQFSEPILIGGDFNTLEHESIEGTTATFTNRGYSWVTRNVRDTTQSVLGAFTLDHLFARGFGTQSAGTQKTEASDHQPVWANVERTGAP